MANDGVASLLLRGNLFFVLCHLLQGLLLAGQEVGLALDLALFLLINREQSLGNRGVLVLFRGSGTDRRICAT